MCNNNKLIKRRYEKDDRRNVVVWMTNLIIEMARQSTHFATVRLWFCKFIMEIEFEEEITWKLTTDSECQCDLSMPNVLMLFLAEKRAQNEV